MLYCSFTILLAFFMFAANAYCACASAAAEQPSRDVKEHAFPSHPGCHGHGPAPGQGHDDQRGSHSCGHCTGTVTADTSGGKTTPPAPLLSPIRSAALPFDLGAIADAIPGTLFHRWERPPPISPPTLLNLGCCLNT